MYFVLLLLLTDGTGFVIDHLYVLIWILVIELILNSLKQHGGRSFITLNIRDH
jgi:hypothetical protein